MDKKIYKTHKQVKNNKNKWQSIKHVTSTCIKCDTAWRYVRMEIVLHQAH